MVQTALIADCRKFAASITAAGGTVPGPLKRLLAAHHVLVSPAPAGRPEDAILDAAMDGTLDEELLSKLVGPAAIAAMTNAYVRDLAGRSEHVVVGAWHRTLTPEIADEILSSMRPVFDTHAQAIDNAKTAGINSESTAEHIIETGSSELVEAWRALPNHLDAIRKIAFVAKEFGPRMGIFPMLTEYHLADNHRVSDIGLMIGAGDLMLDSAAFLTRDAPHRGSAFFRVGLKLNTIAEAKARYADFAADEHDRVHSGPRGGRLINGQIVTDPAPKNPYRKEGTNA